MLEYRYQAKPNTEGIYELINQNYVHKNIPQRKICGISVPRRLFASAFGSPRLSVRADCLPARRLRVYQVMLQYSGALPVTNVIITIARKSKTIATPSVQSTTVAARVPIFSISRIMGRNANAIIR